MFNEKIMPKCQSIYKTGINKGQQCSYHAHYTDGQLLLCGVHSDNREKCQSIYKTGIKKGQQCSNPAYYTDGQMLLCGVHSKRVKFNQKTNLLNDQESSLFKDSEDINETEDKCADLFSKILVVIWFTIIAYSNVYNL